MNGRSREEILRKIKRGLHGDPESKDGGKGVPDTDTSSGKVGEDQKKYEINKDNNLIEQIVKELDNVNTAVRRARNKDDIHEYIRGLIQQKGIKSFTAWDPGYLNSLGLSGLLEGEGLTHIISNDKYEIAEAGIGITGADYAIADTGTLVLLADGKRPRSASLLPPIHVAVVRESDIVSNINELFTILKRKLDSGDPIPSCMTFITGPSRTADIELNLTLGVHGPKELYVIITPD